MYMTVCLLNFMSLLIILEVIVQFEQMLSEGLEFQNMKFLQVSWKMPGKGQRFW